MYSDLYEFLVLHHKLPLSGLGSFLLERSPAKGDFPNKLMHAPSYSIIWKKGEQSDDSSLVQWISHSLGVSLNDARRQLNHFISVLKESIAGGAVIHWKGIGVLEKDMAGELRFLPLHPVPREAPVPAHKVIREKPVHTVRVGEDHRTVEEMTEILSDPVSRRFGGWKLAAGIAAIISIGFLAWYFSQHGFEPWANQQPLQPENELPTTYRLPS